MSHLSKDVTDFAFNKVNEAVMLLKAFQVNLTGSEDELAYGQSLLDDALDTLSKVSDHVQEAVIARNLERGL